MGEENAVSTEEPTFEDLCSMLRRGMTEAQAIAWATNNGLKITEDQAEYLERELNVFDADDLIADDEDETETESEPEEEPETETEPEEAPKKPIAKKKDEAPRSLTMVEKRNAIIGVLLVLAVFIALRRFFFG